MRPTCKDYLEVKRLREQGLTLSQIAASTGRTQPSVRNMIARLIADGKVERVYLWKGERPHPLTSQIIALRGAGLTHREIGARLELSKHTVETIIQRLRKAGRIAELSAEQIKSIRTKGAQKRWRYLSDERQRCLIAGMNAKRLEMMRRVRDGAVDGL